MRKNIPEDSPIEFYFNTVDSTGAPVAPSSAFAAADFSIHKDGSATEKTSANGITVTSPFDSKTGLHLITIDTSNDTGDSGFWVAGGRYAIRFETAKTVDSISIDGRMVPNAEFVIDAPVSVARVTGGINTGAGAITTLDALDTAQDTQHGTTQSAISGLNNISEAQVNAQVDTALSDIGLDHIVSAAVTGTDITDNSIIAKLVSKSATADWDSYVNTTDSMQAIRDELNSGITSISNSLSVVSNNVDSTQLFLTADVYDYLISMPVTSQVVGYFTEIKGATWSTTDTLEAIRDRGDSAWTTATGFSTHSAADVRTEIDANSTQLAAIVLDTGTTLPTQISGLNNISEAQVNTQVDTALSDIGLDHLLSAAATGTDITDNSIIAQLVSKSATADWDSFDNETDSFEAIRDRGDSAWTTGAGGSAPTVEEIRAEIDSNSTLLAAILTDTGTTIPAQISGLNNISTTDVLTQVTSGLNTYDGPTISEMVAAFTEIKGATWATTDTLEAIRDRGDSAWITGSGGTAPTVEEIRAEMDSNSTKLAEIVADTNELQLNQLDWATADVSGLATASALTAIGDNVVLVLADTNELQMNQGNWATAVALATVDSNVDTILAYEDMGNGRTRSEAFNFLRNKFVISAGTMTVYQSDDATESHTAAVTQTAGDPISAVDPA